jgi:hypothetical protein
MSRLWGWLRPMLVTRRLPAGRIQSRASNNPRRAESKSNRKRRPTALETTPLLVESACRTNPLIIWRVRQDLNLQPSGPKYSMACFRTFHFVSN